MNKSCRIGIRIQPHEREQCEKAIKKGHAKSLSELARKALKQYIGGLNL